MDREAVRADRWSPRFAALSKSAKPVARAAVETGAGSNRGTHLSSWLRESGFVADVSSFAAVLREFKIGMHFYQGDS